MGAMGTGIKPAGRTLLYRKGVILSPLKLEIVKSNIKNLILTKTKFLIEINI